MKLIKNIIINTVDIDSSVFFWSNFLETKKDKEISGYIWLKPNETGIVLGFQETSLPNSSLNSVHFDILVQNKKEATDRIIELGGNLIKEGGINNIVSDPNGTQFCVYAES